MILGALPFNAIPATVAQLDDLVDEEWGQFCAPCFESDRARGMLAAERADGRATGLWQGAVLGALAGAALVAIVWRATK